MRARQIIYHKHMHSFTRKSRILRWHHQRKNLINNSRQSLVYERNDEREKKYTHTRRKLYKTEEDCSRPSAYLTLCMHIHSREKERTAEIRLYSHYVCYGLTIQSQREIHRRIQEWRLWSENFFFSFSSVALAQYVKMKCMPSSFWGCIGWTNKSHRLLVLLILITIWV